ncbi:MAG: hypothetical protein H7318_15990 [Oligoflexus sp.]|nr:hypothetical protein [Oligoflexus sp.]
MMRSILGVISLTLLSACGGSSTKTSKAPIQTATIDFQEKYEDYGASFSQDGSKGVFISQRDDGLAHVYIYDSTLADSKVARLDDRLNLDPKAGKEYLNSISSSATWIAFSRTNITAGTNELIVNHFTGTSLASVALAAGHSLNEISFAKGSDNYFAYVERTGMQKTIKVVKVSGDAAALTLEEIGSFADQAKPSLIFFGGKLQLVSLSTADAVNQVVNIRSFDPASPAWTLTSDGSITKSVQVAERPFFVSQAGLFTTSNVSPSRVRKKNGTSPTLATATSENVAVVEDINQKDIFQSALTYNRTSTDYLATEALTVGTISGSLDGRVLMVSGLDSFACAAANTQLSVQKLIRQSDSKVITWIPARLTSGKVWTDAVTNPCAVIDNTLEGGQRQFDGTAARAKFVGFDGDFAVVSIESYVTGDREIRLARFKINWDAGTFSEVSLLEVSSNPRPI